MGHKTFIFLDRTNLCRLVCDYIRTTGIACGIVTGKTKPEEREAARANDVVIGTYACLGTGISWKEYSGIICWHPRRNNYSQFLARACRNGGDRTKSRCWYFLMDNATSLKSQAAGFRKEVERRGGHPATHTYNWQDIAVSDEIRAIAERFASELKDCEETDE